MNLQTKSNDYFDANWKSTKLGFKTPPFVPQFKVFKPKKFIAGNCMK